MPERVADYPRPPRLEPEHRPIRIVLGGATILETSQSWRVLETNHPPTFYLPVAAFSPGSLVPGTKTSFCEWKGRARYFSVHGGDATAPDAAWGYPNPTPAFADLEGHVALYATAMDACFVGEARVEPQPGGFYGGWITPDVIGPFKGGPGTMFW